MACTHPSSGTIPSSPSPGSSPPLAFEQVVALPPGTFLENLTEGPEGGAVITSYFDRKLLLLGPEGRMETLAELDFHPVGIVTTKNGYVVSGHGAPFTQPKAFAGSSLVAELSPAGAVVRRTQLSEAGFLNGVFALSSTQMLIADSVRGSLWLYDLPSGKSSLWLESEVLKADSEAPTFRPGANGIKRWEDSIYVSNSSRGTIHRIPLEGLRPGAPELFASPGAVDDFVFDARGYIYVATHGEALFVIDRQGRHTALIEEGCGGCTSVLFPPAKRGSTLWVLTTGHLLEGGNQPAQVLRVRL